MMNKKMGAGTLYTLDDNHMVAIQPVTTGIPSLDLALGIGGMPWGRIVEIYGPESSGKTTTCLQIIHEYQTLSKKKDHPFNEKPEVVYIDAEHTLDPYHIAKLGVDVSDETGMNINQPDYGEQALDLAEASILSGRCGIVVFDSVAALVPKKDLEGSNEDQTMGTQARMIGKGINRMKGIAAENNVLVIFINQIREKLGVRYGNPETTPGGRALKFFATVRMDVRSRPIKQGTAVIGQTMTFNIKKNKVARPFTSAEVDYYFDTLFDTQKNIVEVAIDQGIIKRAGAWYFIGEDTKNPAKDSCGNELKWMGKDNVISVMKNSPALFQYVNNIVQGFIPKDAKFIDEKQEKQEETQPDLLNQEE
jgi:recombination protein RecA